MIAAHALAEYGEADDLSGALQVLIEAADLRKSTVFVVMLALNAIDALDQKAASLGEPLRWLPTKKRGAMPPRVGGYAPRLIEKIKADLKKGA